MMIKMSEREELSKFIETKGYELNSEFVLTIDYTLRKLLDLDEGEKNARNWVIYAEPFSDETGFKKYLIRVHPKRR